MSLSIKIPKDESSLNKVRQLMFSFQKWQLENHPEHNELINEYFNSGEFKEEILGLPGKYEPPKGQLVYAEYDSEAAGCVALKELDTDYCEMKRLFVYPKFHGKGIGCKLVIRLLMEARALSFKYIRLDTSRDQIQAIRLYERLGFQQINPYYEVQKGFRDWLVFMELKL